MVVGQELQRNFQCFIKDIYLIISQKTFKGLCPERKNENVEKIQKVLNKLNCIDGNRVLTPGIYDGPMENALAIFQRKYMMLEESEILINGILIQDAMIEQ